MDISQPQYSAVEAFLRKNDIGDPWDVARFGSREARANGLSRLVCWTAIKDVYKISMGLTAGQISTAVSAAPHFMGTEDKEELSAVCSRRMFEDFMHARGAGAVRDTISGAAELWSWAMHGGANLDRMFEGPETPKEVLALKMAAACMRRIAPEERGGGQYHRMMALAGAHLNGNGEFDQWLKGLRLGDAIHDDALWQVLSPMMVGEAGTASKLAFSSRGRITEDYLRRATDTRGADRDGVIPSVEAIYTYHPGLSYSAIIARRFAPDTKDINPILSAASAGYSRSLETYSPLMTEDVSVWEVGRDRKKRSQIMLEFDEEPAFKPYKTPNFAGYAHSTYMQKYLKKEAGNLQTVKWSEVPEDDIQNEVGEHEDIRPRRSTVISLDAMVGDTDRDRYEGFADDRVEDMTKEIGESLDEPAEKGYTEDYASAVDEPANHTTEPAGRVMYTERSQGEGSRFQSEMYTKLSESYDLAVHALTEKGKDISLRTMKDLIILKTPPTEKLESFQHDIQEALGENPHSVEVAKLISTSIGLIQEIKEKSGFSPQLGLGDDTAGKQFARVAIEAAKYKVAEQAKRGAGGEGKS